jgi:hypothetical protein
LNDADRAAVTLRYLHDRSIDDVAEILGTTPGAAEKRVQRAVAKLRRMLLRRGIEVAPAALTEVMRQQVLSAAAPPMLTSAAVAANAMNAGNASAAAVAIANKALAAMTMKATAVVAMAFTLLAIGAGTVFCTYRFLGDFGRPQPVRVALDPATRASLAGQTSPFTFSPAPAANSRPALRVGLYISSNTEFTKSHGSPKHSFKNQTAILQELRGADEMDVTPLIEPGSDQKDPALVKELALDFPGKTPLNVEDTESLRRNFDVLIACRACYATEPAMASIESAVRGGAGLVVRQCLGGDNDGYLRETVRHLRLFAEAEPDAILPTDGTHGTGVVLSAHPLLGTLSQRVNRTISIQSMGAYGVLMDTATPLIRMTSVAGEKYQTRGPIVERDGYGAYPLAVGDLGKGRVVSVSIDQMPAELAAATNGRFTIRAARWAAHRAVDD